MDSQVMSHRSAGPVDWGHGVRALEEDWTPQRMGSGSGLREARASPRAPSGPGGKEWEMHLAQALVWNSSSALDRLGDRKPPFSHL